VPASATSGILASRAPPRGDATPTHPQEELVTDTKPQVDPERYRVHPGTMVYLKDWNPRDSGGIPKGAARLEARERFAALNSRLEELQELLYAEGKRKVLIVLQAMDTGGKDGAIRHIFRGTNPSGVKVHSFKVPSAEELAHDYLWRVHKRTPGTGEIAIFNRSHYEDVLVVRVKDLVPRERWERRYEHINAFEKLLVDEGTTILKFYLHISKAEQKKRLQSRLDEPHKNWKFSQADLRSRARWDDFQEAFEAMLTKTSTPWAPWYIIPANRKWFRNLIISKLLVSTLEGFDMQYPPPEEGLDEIVID